MPRKRKNKRYFTKITEIAINAYNGIDDYKKKNRIYNRFIHYPFDKLAENVIHTYKTYYFDVPYADVKANVVAFLNQKIHKFNGANGRAFSYFSVVGKNYLILNNNNNYKKMKIHDDIVKLDYKRNVSSESVTETVDEFNSEFVLQMLEYWDNNITNIFHRQKDILVADSVLELFRKREYLENFNKKALYIMIREMTGSNTQHITRVINEMKKYYLNMLQEFSEVGEVDTSNTGSIF